MPEPIPPTRPARKRDVCEDATDSMCFHAEKVRDLRRRLSDEASCRRRAEVCRVLANRGRLAVLELLALEACCVCDVAHVLEMAVSTASAHLRTLRKAGLAESRHDNKFVFYRARREALPCSLSFRGSPSHHSKAVPLPRHPRSCWCGP